MAEREFTPEEIQSAAEEAKLRDFGDFMFMDPNRHVGETGADNRARGPFTSRRTSRKVTSKKQTTKKRTTDRFNHKQQLICTDWRLSQDGTFETKSCWEDGNMWEFRSRTIHE